MYLSYMNNLSSSRISGGCSHRKNKYIGKGHVQRTRDGDEAARARAMPDRAAAVTTDWLKVRLQEIVTDESREDGRMPRTIECEPTDDLVDKCIPGDEVGLVSPAVCARTPQSGGGLERALWCRCRRRRDPAQRKRASLAPFHPTPFLLPSLRCTCAPLCR